MRRHKSDKSSKKEENQTPFCNEDLFDCERRAEALHEWEKVFLIEEVWGASILPDFNQK